MLVVPLLPDIPLAPLAPLDPTAPAGLAADLGSAHPPPLTAQPSRSTCTAYTCCTSSILNFEIGIADYGFSNFTIDYRYISPVSSIASSSPCPAISSCSGITSTGRLSAISPVATISAHSSTGSVHGYMIVNLYY